MDWRAASLITLALWGVYGIFAAKASQIHGAKVSLAFEAAAFVILTVVVASGSIGEFRNITQKSFFYAALMGLFSAGGFYFLLQALQGSSGKLPIIILISGLYPVVTVVITHFFEQPLLLHQWVGVALATAGVVLVNWGIIR